MSLIFVSWRALAEDLLAWSFLDYVALAIFVEQLELFVECLCGFPLPWPPCCCRNEPKPLVLSDGRAVKHCPTGVSYRFIPHHQSSQQLGDPMGPPRFLRFTLQLFHSSYLCPLATPPLPWGLLGGSPVKSFNIIHGNVLAPLQFALTLLTDMFSRHAKGP